MVDGVESSHIETLKKCNCIDHNTLIKFAVEYSDGVIQGSENIDDEIRQYINEKGVLFLGHCGETYIDQYNDFYSTILN